MPALVGMEQRSVYPPCISLRLAQGARGGVDLVAQTAATAPDHFFRRAFSTFSRDTSICAAVIGLPALATLRQFDSACSAILQVACHLCRTFAFLLDLLNLCCRDKRLEREILCR